MTMFNSPFFQQTWIKHLQRRGGSPVPSTENGPAHVEPGLYRGDSMNELTNM